MKTMVLGASENPERYSHKAVLSLLYHGHEVVPLGLKEGVIEGVKILTGRPLVEHVHTVTMYVGPKNQRDYYDYLLYLKPTRIIFNPGAENQELENLAKANGIEVVEACTLVMLSIGDF